MSTWKSKICRGMDVVETITFIREGVNSEGKLAQASAVYVPGADEQKPRDQWSQAEIDAIGENLAPQLDETLLGSKTPTLE
jgi:hypothetical protein